MNLDRRIKPTLTPIELDVGDTLRLARDDGTTWHMTLQHTAAAVLVRGSVGMSDAGHYGGDILVYTMTAVVEINGREHELVRYVGDQRSFYEPWVIEGVRVWFDAAKCAFIHPPVKGGIIHEKDWTHGQVCAPLRSARFVLQQADRPIAPEPIGKWFDEQKKVPDIRECYTGQDCWMGPYNGGAAHCGLDVNMPKGTRLTAPIALDDQFVFNDARGGSNCGRWRGSRRWNRGSAQDSEWIIQSHHIVETLVPERQAVARGTPYAIAAGTGVGAVEHSHFMFRIIEQGGDYLVDPWILFWAAGRS